LWYDEIHKKKGVHGILSVKFLASFVITVFSFVAPSTFGEIEYQTLLNFLTERVSGECQGVAGKERSAKFV